MMEHKICSLWVKAKSVIKILCRKFLLKPIFVNEEYTINAYLDNLKKI